MEELEYLKIFGKNVLELRNNKGWSQERLAEEANLHKNYVGFVERAERKVSIVVAIKLAKALEVDYNEIFKMI